MSRYTFQVTIITSISVHAECEAKASCRLRQALAGATANFGMLDDEPIVASIEIEGDLDLIDKIES
jgi:hypothetical protein